MERENQIIASIYDAALDSKKWQEVIADIVNYTSSKAAIFTALDQFNPAFNFIYTHNIPAEGINAYCDERVKVIDMKLHLHLWTSIGLGGVVVQNCSHYSETPNTDQYTFYEKCLKPADVCYLAGVLLERGEYRWGVFGLHRSLDNGEFKQKELEFLERIGIHLRRALQIHKQISLLELEKFSAYEALNAVKIGVILLDHRQSIKFTNQVAQNIVAKNLEIDINQYNHLKFGKSYQSQFNQLIHIRDKTLKQDAEPMGGVMSIQDANGHKVMLTVTPFLSKSAMGDINNIEEIALYMTDQYQQHTLSRAYLKQSYKLTNREIGLCESLINGFTPEEIAKKDDLSIHSIRTYMKNIYEKMGVSSQIELMHMLNGCISPFQHIA